MKRFLPGLLLAALLASPALAQSSVGLGPLKSAIGQATTASPTAPASTASFAMQGLSSGVPMLTTFTSGNLLITICGTITAAGNTIGDGITYKIAYGTGLGPANAAAATGTVIGLAQTFLIPAATAVSVPFSISANVTGVKLAANVWADLQAESVAHVSNVALSNVTVHVEEIR